MHVLGVGFGSTLEGYMFSVCTMDKLQFNASAFINAHLY